MKRLMLNRVLAALALCAAVALPAQATIVDFEDVAPTLFSGSSESSGGFSFASSGAGFSGIDEAGAFLFGVAPPNSSGQFLFGLNGDVLTMTQSGGGSFRLLGLDASFLPPLPDLGAGLQAGQLHIEALTVGGLITADFDFGLSDANGAWSFASFATDAMASGVTAVSFSACVYDFWRGGFGCFRDDF